MTDELRSGMFIGKGSIKDSHSLNKSDYLAFEKIKQSHRDEYHLFFLQERGTTTLEIDFKQHEIKPFTVTYIHPNQVHRLIDLQNTTVSFLAISNEHINPEYLKLLEEMVPVSPLLLKQDDFTVISEISSLCITLFEQNKKKLHHSILKDSFNTWVGFVISNYLDKAESNYTLSRFGIISKAFRAILEKNFATAKRPSEYAEKLNISTPYLNECVKNTTGFSVSHHIQQRVVLEAKRLLYHSDKSVKEIATELGYDDYPYFSRLFTKVTGMTAITFRRKTAINTLKN
ncbi:helix-turn-helix domain-containing protein [Larkinella sp. VNQ87]|uniref:helix-turn-helix domain-containing protein n=1 Tax=Larkinella sp. VNQ87 TaxID=3400921 RepID=UPI003C10D750